jgi:hypothetical protein
MLKSCNKFFFSLFFSFFLSFSINAQDVEQNKLDTFSGKLITAIRSQAKPRAVIFSDKSIYRAGETIWFNCYLINSISQKITTKSNYLFVDVVNENDEVIKIAVLDPQHQQLNSKIILPDSIGTGYYWVRAYTRQMTKGDSNYCSVKPIYVFNKNHAALKKKAVKENVGKQENFAVISFYPEGQSIITRANSIVAFYIHDLSGKPLSTEGIIKDSRDSIVTRFTSDKNGLGKFSFSPSRFRKYKAIIQGGKESGYDLPPFNFKAAQLSVSNQSAGNRMLTVLLEDSIYSKTYTTYILGVSKDSLCYAAIGRGEYAVSVPDNKFRQGIVTFYLFDTNFKLLSERSIYVKENNLLINATMDKNSYAKKSKANLNISITDKNKQTIPSLISVAVIDSMFSDHQQECFFHSFSETALNKIDNISMSALPCLTDAETDLIMLLRKAPPVTISNNQELPSAAEEDSLFYIKGIVLSEKNEGEKNKIVTLLSKSGNGIFVTDTTDSNGRFSFPIEGYADSTQFSLSVKNLNGKTPQSKIILDSLHFPVFRTPASLKEYFFPEPAIAKYRNNYLGTDLAGSPKETLPLITLKGKTRPVVNYDESKRVSQSSSILSSDNIEEGTTLGTAIFKISGLHLTNGYLLIGGPTSMNAPSAKSEPLILVDGQEAPLLVNEGRSSSPAMGFLNSIRGTDIDFVEVIKGAEAANFGIRGGNGVININTARNSKDKLKSNNGMTNFFAKGISTPANFPLINYDKKFANSDLDNRSTIFWNGSVLADGSTNINFNFFTTGIPANYKVVINGITAHGDIIYKTISFDNK